MNQVIVIASNGCKKVFKTKGDFDVLFTALAPSIKSAYFFKQKDLDYINNSLTKIGCTAYDARVFVIGGRRTQITSTRLDGRSKKAKTLPYFHWDDVYQFMMDNAQQKDVCDWLLH